jgi:hypothetical protein
MHSRRHSDATDQVGAILALQNATSRITTAARDQRVKTRGLHPDHMCNLCRAVDEYDAAKARSKHDPIGANLRNAEGRIITAAQDQRVASRGLQAEHTCSLCCAVEEYDAIWAGAKGEAYSLGLRST